jgi:predicted kinase
MVYLVGGPLRSGKSRLRDILLKEYKIPGMSTDILMNALGKSIYNSKVSNNSDINLRQLLLTPIIESIIDELIKQKESFLIEGSLITPGLVNKYKDVSEIKGCFLGYKSVEVEQKLKDIKNNPNNFEWTFELSDHELRTTLEEHIRRSKELAIECTRLNIKYFDTAQNFEHAISLAKDYLID